jgi:hypothetical protein
MCVFSCNAADSSNVDAADCYGVCIRLAGQILLLEDCVCLGELSFIYLCI